MRIDYCDDITIILLLVNTKRRLYNITCIDIVRPAIIKNRLLPSTFTRIDTSPNLAGNGIVKII